MAELPIRVLVFMTGRNCEMYVEDAIQSVARQSHPNTHILFVDDSSDDRTHEIAQQTLSRLMPGHHDLVRNTTRLGKAYSSSVHLREASQRHDVVVVLDADDQLLGHDVFAKLADCYRQGRDVVWTNFVTDRGRVGANRALDPNQSPRLQGWRTSHLFSFRASLLRNVPQSHFQYPDGRWLDAACDLALAFPILDQTRRYEFLPIRAYRYTESNPQSHHNLGPEASSLNSPKQRQCAQIVMSKPELPRVDVKKDPPAAPASTSAASPWDTACAMDLANRVPKLIHWLASQPGEDPDPWLGMAWLHRLQDSPERRVLVLGDGVNAAMLTLLTEHAAAQAYQLMATAEDRLPAPEATPPHLHHRYTRWTEFCFEDRVAYMPDLTELPEGILFDTVLLTPSAFGARRDAMIALAGLVNHLQLQDFSLWIEGLTPQENEEASVEIGRLMPELRCTTHRGPASALHLRS